MTSQRLQRKRTRGWRKPPGAVIVTRPSRWGNPFAVGTTLVRYPALDGGEWEHEGRIKTPGERHPYKHPDGTVTWHRVEIATRAQVVELYRLHTGPGGKYELNVDVVRAELAGRDLLCWCPLPAEGEPDVCHAAVLLEVANQPAPAASTRTTSRRLGYAPAESPYPWRKSVTVPTVGGLL